MADPLNRAIDARIDAYRPETVPPFAVIEARELRGRRWRLAALARAVSPVRNGARPLPVPCSSTRLGEGNGGTRRFPRLGAVPAAFLVVALTAGATVAAVAQMAVEDPTSVWCSADMSATAVTGARADGRSPTAMCADLWLAGEVAAGTRLAPPLQACLQDGRPVVYPASDACGRLGLPEAAPYSELDLQVIAVNEDLQELGRGGCFPAHEARRAVADVLRRHGLDWPVQTGRWVDEDTCVFAVVTKAQRVELKAS